MSSQVIAIDGPSGSGKSSTSRGVAQQLGLSYLDTGSMYRAVAVAWLDSDVSADDSDGIARLAEGLNLEVGTDPAAPTIAIDQRDVTAEIRESRVAEKVSAVATNLGVRAVLTDQMRAIIEHSGRRIVVEGRDITTVVAPDADLRVLLVADPAARIARRQAELDPSVTAAEVNDQVIRRDRDDATVSQFEQPAEGVVLVDSTFMTLPEVIDHICELAAAAESGTPAASDRDGDRKAGA